MNVATAWFKRSSGGMWLTAAMSLSVGLCLTVFLPASQAQSYGDNAFADATQESGSGTARSSTLGNGQGAFRARWQSLSPDQKRVLLNRFMKNRANRMNGQTQASSGTYGALGRGAGRTAGSERQALPSDCTVRSDVAYGQDPLQKLDIYAPKAEAGALPVLMFVHGGGWRRGDKAAGDRSAKGAVYSEHGVIFVSVNYRLAPAVKHPEQVEDIASAFVWVREHAGQFGGDAKHIYLMGHSAGAHLVDLLGTNDRFLKEKGLGLSAISGVISLDTASLDLLANTGNESMESGMIADMINNAFGKEKKVLADGSPLLHAHRGEAYPPFLMYCGSRRLAALSQHKQFVSAMKSAGGSVQFYSVPLSHRDINLESGRPQSEIFKSVMAMIAPGTAPRERAAEPGGNGR